MTAADFLLIACLLLIHVAIGTPAKPVKRRAAITVACLAFLPLTFGHFVPISHFIFQSTSRTTLVVMQGVVALLLLTLAWRLPLASQLLAL